MVVKENKNCSISAVFINLYLLRSGINDMPVINCRFLYKIGACFKVAEVDFAVYIGCVCADKLCVSVNRKNSSRKRLICLAVKFYDRKAWLYRVFNRERAFLAGKKFRMIKRIV